MTPAPLIPDDGMAPAGMPNGLWGRIAFLLFPSQEFAAKKFRDHRRFTAVVYVILGVFLPFLWVWDYVTDPVGARETIGLRLLYLLILIPAFGFWWPKVPPRWLQIAPPLLMLAAEVLYVEILNHLQTGMIYGLAGFMYVMFIAVLGTQCYSLVLAIGYTLFATILPTLMAALGLAPGFPYLSFAILVWPAAGLTILSQAAFAYHYLYRYYLEQQLKFLSDTDPLSGARNRRYFMPRLDSEVVRAHRLRLDLALLMLDIDFFKKVNDTYGHPTGDLVIRQLADICLQVSRKIDVVGRVGGEEFAVLLPGATIAQATDVAERIRAQAEGSSVQSQDGKFLNFTVSVGVAEVRPDDNNGTDLFSRADAALYEAKNSGRNRVMSG